MTGRCDGRLERGSLKQEVVMRLLQFAGIIVALVIPGHEVVASVVDMRPAPLHAMPEIS